MHTWTANTPSCSNFLFIALFAALKLLHTDERSKQRGELSFRSGTFLQVSEAAREMKRKAKTLSRAADNKKRIMSYCSRRIHVHMCGLM